MEELHIKSKIFSILIIGIFLISMNTSSAWYSQPYDNAYLCQYTHGILVAEAVEMLESDKGASVASEFKSYRQYLCWGSVEEDKGAILNTHYFHPDTHDNSKDASKKDAGNLANTRYSSAYSYYESSDKVNAFKYLGRAVHFVADLTNPYHSKGVSGGYHSSMELWVEDQKIEYIEGVNSNYNGIYSWSASGTLLPSSTAEGFVDYAAHQSYPRYSEVDENNEWEDGNVIDNMLSLAVRLTAGLLYKFWIDLIYTPPPPPPPNDDGCYELFGRLVCP